MHWHSYGEIMLVGPGDTNIYKVNQDTYKLVPGDFVLIWPMEMHSIEDADMEQALAKCKVKSGPYMVCPVLAGTNPRAILGKILDTALDPSTYVGFPIASLVKLGFSINKTAYMQPMMIFLESNFADPYDVAKKFYGIDNYIKK